MTDTEYEAATSATLSIERASERKRGTLDDILYTVMGEASLGNLIAMVFAIAFFGSVPMAMLLLFGAYSGGMRWLITLGLVAAMGMVAVYLMKRGLASGRGPKRRKEPQTVFTGELTDLTSTFDRAASGYMYSQQLIRERLCDCLLDKLATGRDLDPEMMARRLEAGDASFVGDEVLGAFLLAYWSGLDSVNDTLSRGKSAERGRKFMSEIDIVIERMEALI